MIQRPPEEQHRRYDAFAAMAIACDNLGQTDDQRDLYAVLDALVADIQAANPPFACQAGCNHCCYTPPMVTSLEWQALYKHLLALPPEKQLQVIDAAERLRPLAPALQAKLQAILQGRPDQAGAVALQCPLLVDGRCAAYAGRPLICRGFGYVVASHQGPPQFFGSPLAKAHIAQHFPKDLVLPRFDPYVQQVGRLNAGKGVQAYLPQWLWAHIRDRRFLPQANLNPDFS